MKKNKPAKAIPPEKAAAYVLEHVEDGPHLFTSKGDKQSYKLLTGLPSKLACEMMGTVMDKNFSQGYDQLEDEFEDKAGKQGQLFRICRTMSIYSLASDQLCF